MKSLRFAAAHSAGYALLWWSAAGIAAICAVIGALSLVPWTHGGPRVSADTHRQLEDSNEPISPIVAPSNLDRRKVDLGRKLFNDPRLSHNDQVSCSTCHNLNTGGTDRKARSVGINGSVGKINAPTVLNSAFNFSQSWDGRHATLEQQVDDPLQSPIEMASNWQEVIGKVQQSPEYVLTFRQIYGSGIQAGRIRNAIAEFERSLATPDSRFDRFLRHQLNAITAQERAGYEMFKSFGCASCHQGMNVGGNMYQKLGVMAPYFTDRGHITAADRGRFNVTGEPRDLYMFKVPSLRNVELTPPYLHDGSAATLADAVRVMAKYQLGHPLTDDQVASIVGFLKTLTGKLPEQSL